MRTARLENVGCNAQGEGWVEAWIGHRLFRWNFPARYEAEFLFWTNLILGALDAPSRN